MPQERPPDFLTVQAAAQPGKLAVVDDRRDGGVQCWNYAELNQQANRLANVLLGLGVQPRDKVVWCGQNSLAAVRMIHAARKIGAIAVPLNYRLVPEEMAYMTNDCGAAVVYIDAEYAASFASIRDSLPAVRQVLVFDGPPLQGQVQVEDLLAAASDAEPVVDMAEAAGTMTYTSGTTGRPKGALRTGFGDPGLQRNMVGMIGYRPDDVYLSTGPLYHAAQGAFLGIATSLGNTVVLQRKFDPEDWLRLLVRYGVTCTFSAPTPVRMLCNLPAAVKAGYDRSGLRIMVANAAPWSFALKLQYLADFPENSLWELYGSTELGVNTLLEPRDQRRKPGSCGKPLPGVEIALFDDAGIRITLPNVPGELAVRSKSAFSTYHNAQDKYDSNRRGDYLTVGDVAYFDEEGYFYICDRKSDMIVSGGMKIYPAEVEAALESHPDIHDVAVFGIPNDEWGESVHAVVVRAPGSTPSAEAVIAHARQHLAGYKIPRSVDFTGEIPRNASGKILKRELRAPFWAGRSRQVG
jgi:acyl-CoA synthetase (AMP-forming)/AMP-acid ligase II